jgi:hypothetical protein
VFDVIRLAVLHEPEISLVEEIPDQTSDDPVYRDDFARPAPDVL